MGLTVFKENTANAATKSAIKAAGGGTLCLAIAMEEDKHLVSQPHGDYPFGDIYPGGAAKTGDAANFGVYKMNWYMLQQCASARPLIGSQPPNYAWRSAGTRINNDVGLATKLLLEAMNTWSIAAPKPAANNFWGGHRWGQSGLDNAPGVDWKDIRAYYDAVLAIKAECDKDADVWASTTRYGVKVKNV